MSDVLPMADSGRDAYAWAGVLPFAAGVVGALSPALRPWATLGFVAYAASILSFLGGLRWGRGLVVPTRGSPWAGSVWSSLLASAAIVLATVQPVAGVGLLAAGFAAMGWQDIHDLDWPASFRGLRRRLSAVVIALHLALGAVLLTAG